MIVRSMFEKDIRRDIKGVIKVGQDEDSNIKQELEEYVVTKELQKHFAEFFKNFKKGIEGATDKVGVWISGFFGSGKSHFLKILSYLLENRDVDGKKAIDYFVDDNKIDDNFVMGDIRMAGNISNDVILFNVDSKSSAPKNSIVKVFLKVFNTMLGYSPNLFYLADLERKLDAEGKYAEFKTKFKEINGGDWEEERNEFDFIQDDVVDALVEMNFMSAESARNWCEKANQEYEISIEDFATLVKKYIDTKGRNHHVTFMVDEIGQYIGDNSQLMLNLQTVVEELGRQCKGKAWVVVTSQQNIDQVTKVIGGDFSKIQGRFDTRISLSSADVDEVIKKRILAKNKSAEQNLSMIYSDKSALIKNLITFNSDVEMKLYKSGKDFADVYPFVPYQFNLMASVLTSIREHGSDGKHLSEGERSMLAMFKESAESVSEQEEGVLVPIDLFYNAIEKFIDHSHRSVIIRAEKNEKLEVPFDVKVLKTLFLIKYVKEVTPNIETITSLMIDNIDDDRLELKKNIEESLKRLVSQVLVQKSGDLYIFLTNEEQEINREIKNMNIELSEVIAKVSEVLFTDIYTDSKFRYSTRYNFEFNKVVDDRFYRNVQSNDISLKIITPDNLGQCSDSALRMQSQAESSVLVKLPDDGAFLDEVRSTLQIEKFLKKNSVGMADRFAKIKIEKQQELRERRERAKLLLEDSLRNSTIYVNGDVLTSSSKDATSKINEALGKLVNTIYYKLSYMDSPVSDADIIKELTVNSNQISLDLKQAETRNKQALDDVLNYIESTTRNYMKVSMKSIKENYMKAPYGFVEEDIEWLVAKLFRNGEISLTINNEEISLLNRRTDDLQRFICRREYLEKLLISRRMKVDRDKLRVVKSVMKELFDRTPMRDDEDAIISEFKSCSNSMINELTRISFNYNGAVKYPGQQIVSDLLKLLKTVNEITAVVDFYSFVSNKQDDLEELYEQLDPIKNFFDERSQQKKLFDDAVRKLAIYEDSKSFVVSEEVAKIAREIEGIIKSERPYNRIHSLIELIDKFNNTYCTVLDETAKPIYGELDMAKAEVFKYATDNGVNDEVSDKFRKQFDELKDKLDHSNNVATVHNVRLELDVIKVRMINEIDAIVASKKVTEGEPVKNIRKKKNVSFKELTAGRTWVIENEDDVDKYLNELKNKILANMDKDTTINIIN